MWVVKNIIPDVLIQPDWIAFELNIVSLRQDINIEAKQPDIRVIRPLLQKKREEREIILFNFQMLPGIILILRECLHGGPGAQTTPCAPCSAPGMLCHKTVHSAHF